MTYETPLINFAAERHRPVQAARVPGAAMARTAPHGDDVTYAESTHDASRGYLVALDWRRCAPSDRSGSRDVVRALTARGERVMARWPSLDLTVQVGVAADRTTFALMAFVPCGSPLEAEIPDIVLAMAVTDAADRAAA